MSAKPVAQRCGTCRFLQVQPNSAGRVIARSDKSYRCTYEVPWPALPDSITKDYNFKMPSARAGQWMTGDAGETCPTWEARPKPEAVA